MSRERLSILIKPQGYLCHVTVDWPSLGSREEAAIPNPNRGGQEEVVPAVWSLRLPSFLCPGPYTNRSEFPASLGDTGAEIGKHGTPTLNQAMVCNAQQIRFWGPITSTLSQSWSRLRSCLTPGQRSLKSNLGELWGQDLTTGSVTPAMLSYSSRLSG